MYKSCIIVILLLAAAFASAQPYIPEDPAQIIMNIRQADELQALKTLRQQLGQQPDNLALVENIVERYISLGREHADERYFSYAESLLKPYLDTARYGPVLLLQWADILQRQHRFEAAVNVLDELLQYTNANPHAHLMRAVIYQVKGDYAAAMQDCRALLGRVDMLLATTCIAQIHGLQGDLSASAALLESSIQRYQQANNESLAWSRTVLAEMLVRLGRPQQALMYLQQVISGSKDYYALALMADILLQQQRFTEVLVLLDEYRYVGKLLLRYVIAATGQQRLQVDDERALQALIQRMRLFGASAHKRMLARYYLDVRNDSRRALEFARHNWQQQREPDDALLLLRCLLATGDLDGLQDFIAGLRQNGWHDERIELLLTGVSV